MGNVPRSWNRFPIKLFQFVYSFSYLFSYSKWAFSIYCQLPVFCFSYIICSYFWYQVAYIEASWFHAWKLFMIDFCLPVQTLNSAKSLSSKLKSNFTLVNSSFATWLKILSLRNGSLNSTGIMASVPYVNQKGVLLLAD